MGQFDQKPNPTAADIEAGAREIQATWDNRDRHFVRDPEGSLGSNMLLDAVRDFEGMRTRIGELQVLYTQAQAAANNLRREAIKVRKQLRDAAPAVHWASSPHTGRLSLAAVAKLTGYRLRKLRTILLERIDSSLLAWLLKRPQGRCPICKRRRAGRRAKHKGSRCPQRKEVP